MVSAIVGGLIMLSLIEMSSSRGAVAALADDPHSICFGSDCEGDVATVWEIGHGGLFVKAAVDRFHQLAEAGNIEAQVRLAEFYAGGQVDGSIDFEQAFYWYRKAAMGGHPKAQMSLGLYYLNGWGVKASLVKAWIWLKRADEQGQDRAQGYRKDVEGKMSNAEKGDAQRRLSDIAD